MRPDNTVVAVRLKDKGAGLESQASKREEVGTASVVANAAAALSLWVVGGLLVPAIRM